MTYVVGFVIAVPAANRDAYLKHASEAASLMKEFGAGRMVEAWGDDVPDGKTTDFKRAVKAAQDEVVVFSWLEYPDKKIAGAANEKMQSDPRMSEMGSSMPFDGQRMIFGGFSVGVDVGKGGRMSYVDGTLVPVPAEHKDAYRTHAEKHARIILEHGASRVVDTWEDDVSDGKVTDFRKSVKAKPGEAITFGWIEWPSKKVRDEAWGKIMADERMRDDTDSYDHSRRVYGGFVPIFDK